MLLKLNNQNAVNLDFLLLILIELGVFSPKFGFGKMPLN